jgi:hypothetical protein
MWGAKWLIAGLVFGWSRAWSDVSGQIGKRTTGGGRRVSNEFGAATEKTVAVFLDRPFASILCALAVGVTAMACRSWSRNAIAQRTLLVAPVLIVPLWLEVLSQHSQMHPHFVYRSVSICLGLTMMVISAVFPGEREVVELMPRTESTKEPPA